MRINCKNVVVQEYFCCAFCRNATIESEEVLSVSYLLTMRNAAWEFKAYSDDDGHNELNWKSPDVPQRHIKPTDQLMTWTMLHLFWLNFCHRIQKSFLKTFYCYTLSLTTS